MTPMIYFRKLVDLARDLVADYRLVRAMTVERSLESEARASYARLSDRELARIRKALSAARESVVWPSIKTPEGAALLKAHRAAPRTNKAKINVREFVKGLESVNFA